MEIHEILTASAAIIGAIAGIWSLIQQKKKTEAEADREEATAADTIQGASKELIEQYKLRNEELLKEINNLKCEIIALKAEMEALKQELEGYRRRR